MFTTDKYGRVNYPLGLKMTIKAICMKSLEDAGFTNKPHFTTYFQWSKSWIASGKYSNYAAGSLVLKVNMTFVECPYNVKVEHGCFEDYRTEPIWFVITESMIRDWKLNNLLK